MEIESDSETLKAEGKKQLKAGKYNRAIEKFSMVIGPAQSLMFRKFYLFFNRA